MIDIHMHTIWSDGSDSVDILLKNAQKKNLELISITDHNSVEGYKHLDNAQDLFSGKILNGVELNTTLYGETAEILGYGIDIPEIRKYISDNYPTKPDLEAKTFEKLLPMYKKLGIVTKINKSDYDPTKYPAIKFIHEDIGKYEENRKFYTSADSIDCLEVFYRKEINNINSPLYFDLSSFHPTPEHVIAAIRKAGGLAFFAHMFIYSENVYSKIEEFTRTYKPDGYECFYSRFTSVQSEYLQSYCKANGLYISGGSDYHGAKRADVEMGTGCGNLHVDEKEVYRWAKRYL